eukprot:TRINITY_DN3109_c0_g2_i1.p1 TRINITY_DN3109_c0_g2~~TRINITY_DN3109_c0_g2_i1.p1  ORF type:complete len:248 (-),score=50.85 TRINITY_DN3109_c0_g2_i1:243-986(-)
MTDSNSELEAKLENLMKELRQTEESLEYERTKQVSDPDLQLDRILTQNLARNSLSAKDDRIGDTLGKGLDGEVQEGEGNSLESELREMVLGECGELFVNYSGYETLESLNINEREDCCTQTGRIGCCIEFLEDKTDIVYQTEKKTLSFITFTLEYTKAHTKPLLVIAKATALSILNEIEETKSVSSDGSSGTNLFDTSARDTFDTTTDPLKSFFILVRLFLTLDSAGGNTEQREHQRAAVGNLRATV